MNAIRRTFRDYWFFQRAESLAAFRILLGLTILASLATGSFRTMRQTCAEDGICPIECNDDWLRRGGRVSLLRGPDSIPLLGEWLPAEWAKDEADERTRLSYYVENWVSPETKKAWAEWGRKLSSHYLLAAIYVMALVGLVVGFRPRLMAFVAALLAATFHHRLAEMMNGGDALFRNGLYFLVLAPSGLTWSVDRWLRTRPWSIDNRLRRRLGMPPLTPGEPVFVPWWWVPWVWLMQLQICIMYFFTGSVKFDTDYLNGEALYWVMNDLCLTRWSYAMVPVPMFVCRLMTWTTLIFELGFVFLVWLGPRPRWLLVGGYAAHAVAFAVIHACLGHSLGVQELYPAVAAAGLLGLLVMLRVMTGKWSGEAEPGSLAEVGRWVLIVGAALHVALLLYLGASTLLVPLPFLAMGFLIGLLICAGPSWRWVLLTGVMLHVGILLVMEIGWFSQVTLCWYLLFVPGARLAEVARATAAWLRGGAKAPAVAAP